MQYLENCLAYCVDWERLDYLIDASERRSMTVREMVDTPVLEGFLPKVRKRLRVTVAPQREFQVGHILD